MVLQENDVKKLISRRPLDSHKGSFGKVLVVAGSKNYPGAAYLVCCAALRAGAGLVTLCSTTDVCAEVLKMLPEATFLPVEGTHLDLGALELIQKEMSRYDSVVIGCGLGRDQGTTDLVNKLLPSLVKPAVVDADGLFALGNSHIFGKKTVLTPHPGEMSQLSGKSIDEIQSNREKIAIDFAKANKVTLVLKGANTIIASNQSYVINDYASPILATPGTGDVLTGIIAAFLSQGMDEFASAILGVYIHTQTAKKLSQKLGDRGMLASDLLGEIPYAIKELLDNR